MIYPMPRLTATEVTPAIASRQGLVEPPPYELKHGGQRSRTRFGVLHMTAGGSALSSLKHLHSVGLSYHYVIERDGVIYRGTPSNLIAYHAGESAWPGSAGGSLNPESLGVCLANWNGSGGRREEVSEAQYLSAVWLCAVLAEQYRVPADRWLGHLEVSPGRKTDPDVEVFSMAAYRSDLTLELYRRRRDGIAGALP